MRYVLCVCVCVCVCVYVCVYSVCMYVYVYVCMCVYICMCVYTYVCMYVCMYVCTYVCTYVRMYVCTYACMYVCTVQSKGNVALARNSILVPRQLYPPYSSLDVHNASKGRVLNHSKTESLDRVLAVPLLARVIPCGSCGHLNTRVGPAGGLPIDKDVRVFSCVRSQRYRINYMKLRA